MSDFEKLKAFIDKKGLTMYAFGVKIGVSISYLPNLKKENRTININTMSKICAAFPDFDAVGFIVSETPAEWQQCLEAKTTPPRNILTKTKLPRDF